MIVMNHIPFTSFEKVSQHCALRYRSTFHHHLFFLQGMRCPANTHKPSFHVNTMLSSKHDASGKGASTSHRGGGAMPNAKFEETMTEEELFEWLQNAMQSGMFEAGGGSTTESPSAKSGTSSKGNSGMKKKRKGKKQW